MSRDPSMYDPTLLGILNNEGKIENFLDTIFGFLQRRTDFYLLLAEDGKSGFPSGVAEQHVFKAFKKYQFMTQLAQNKVSPQKVDPLEVQEEVVVTEPVPSADGPLIDLQNSNQSPDKTEASKDNKPKMKEWVTLERTGQALFQSNPDSYNGAAREDYSWSQTITDADVKVKVGTHISKGSSVKVVIQNKHLSVSEKEGSDWRTIIEDDLRWPVNASESVWTLMPGQSVNITLEKLEERWWDSLLLSEPKINVKEIDASRPMSDLDEESKATVDQLLFDEDQKRRGLLTSKQMQTEQMLRDAWDKDGSPFKGTPFDISKVNIS